MGVGCTVNNIDINNLLIFYNMEWRPKMNAFVNGYKAIIYGFEQVGIFTYIDCYLPELDIREKIISHDVYLR